MAMRKKAGKTVKTGRTAKSVHGGSKVVQEAATEPVKSPARKTGKAKAAANGARSRSNGTALVIVESPTKAKTIGKYLGAGYDVKATIGHVRDLPTRELGVDVERGFEPKYVTIKGKTKTLADLKKAAKGATAIYLATDPDREGEAIAWHVADQLKSAVPTHRILFHEITKDAIQAALRQPGVIVDREREIRAFTPQEYWTIEALCAKNGQTFEAALHKVSGHKPQLHTEADARAIVDAVRPRPFLVSKVEKKNRKKNPAAPFTTSTLQQEAAKKLGFSSRRTMRAAQDLYEGKDVGEDGPVGLITYMRTDSPEVSVTAIASVRDFIKKSYAKAYLPESPNQYRPKKAARVQGAHEAIRPTDVSRRPEQVQSYLEPDQYRLYQLIWQRFVASQMTPAVYDMTIVDFDLGEYLFRASGSVLVFDGYHVLYTEGREKEEGKTMDDLPPIPPLAVGDQVEVREITPSQHFTEPPPRFSEASLVKELERLGIGRPSTYSAIISTLSAREYVKVEQRRFFPTELGEMVEKIMVGKFPEIFNIEFTSGMENELDRIEDGELAWQRVLEDFYKPFSKALGAVDMKALVADAHGLKPEELAKERCPKCGSAIELRTGRFGPYLACLKYKDTCDYVKSLKKDKVPDRPSDEKCHLCSSPMVIKTGRFGEFLACTTYPNCKGTRSIPMGLKCPKCNEGDLTERRTKRGKSFWGCLRYPECDFSTWNRPVPETCPSCGWLGMEKKISKAEGETRKCLKCGHQLVVAEPEEVALG